MVYKILFFVFCACALLNSAMTGWLIGKSRPEATPAVQPQPLKLGGERIEPLRRYQASEDSATDLTIYCVSGYEWIVARDGSVQPHFNPLDRAIECGGKK